MFSITTFTHLRRGDNSIEAWDNSIEAIVAEQFEIKLANMLFTANFNKAVS